MQFYPLFNFTGFKSAMASKFMRILVSVFILVFTYSNSMAQENVITAGFQFKPIFSSKFFNTGPEKVTEEGVSFSILPKSGYCFGMVIRKGITKTISLETGINYVKRNYALNVEVDTIPDFEAKFSLIGYEIPIQGLVFIQLSDRIFMDVALGFSMDFYPSDLFTKGEYFEHSSDRNSWFSPAVLANLGWEYRTEKSGYLYFGASYHNPFSFISRSFIVYPAYSATAPQGVIDLKGNYLTVDLRYYFHADPEKRKKKIRKTDKRTR